jgi:hypothetical protein
MMSTTEETPHGGADGIAVGPIDGQEETAPSSSSRVCVENAKLYYQQDALTNAAMKLQYDIFVKQAQKFQQILTTLRQSDLKNSPLGKMSSTSEQSEDEQVDNLLNRRILPEEYVGSSRKIGTTPAIEKQLL